MTTKKYKAVISEFEYPKSVIIWWLDATTRIGWESADEDIPLSPVCTHGFLIKETPDAYIVTISLCTESERNASIAVPKAWVLEFYELEIIDT